MKYRYLTTTLPYVNAEPHIGFAREIVQADVMARYLKMAGNSVFFNTGTDEHGQKVLEKAQEKGMEPQAYANSIVDRWKELKSLLDLSYDRFIRTTEEKHISAAKDFWKICDQSGYIYKKNYKAKYCVGCELIKTDSELDHGECPDHPGRELEIIEEENYFFKFSSFGDKLLNFYRNNKDFVVPQKRFNEVVSFVERGLEDFSISRLKSKMPWGIEVPGDPNHVMYVWFDALVDYISTLGWPTAENFEKFWNGAEERIQFCGKDNLRQQSAMWQAMLMAAGIKNSSKIFVNGFINVAGQKMSKTLGNVISPKDMVERYGTDATRYLLLSMGSFGEDTDVTWEKMDEKYNADLANGLGNLLSRVVKLAAEEETTFSASDNIATPEDEILGHIKTANFEKAIVKIQEIVKKNDRLIEETRPWELKKNDQDEFREIIAKNITDLWLISSYLEPLMPETSQKIKHALETKQTEPLFRRI